jgi:hypothetical protein
MPDIVVEVHHASMRNIEMRASAESAIGKLSPRQGINAAGQGFRNHEVEVHLILKGSQVLDCQVRKASKKQKTKK